MTPAETRRRDLEELAGGSPVVLKRGPGRPRKDQSAPKAPVNDDYPASADDTDMSFKSAHMASKGLPVRWYSHAFGMTEHQIKSRVRKVSPVAFGAHNNPLYAMLDVAPLLVEPKVDLKEFLAGIKDDDLPDDLRLKLWNARRVRNRVREEEGELWHTSVVVEKFSEVLLAIREKLQLIPEKVGRMSGITPEQYKLIRAVVDGVQEDMHKTIMEMADADATLSVLGEQDEVVL